MDVFTFWGSTPELIFLTILSAFVVSQGYGVQRWDAFGNCTA